MFEQRILSNRQTHPEQVAVKNEIGFLPEIAAFDTLKHILSEKKTNKKMIVLLEQPGGQ